MRLLLLLSLSLVLWCPPALARHRAAVSPGYGALQRTLVRTVRVYNQQVRRGRPAMDLGLVFRLVGHTLERTNGDNLAAEKMATRAARWTAGRSPQKPLTLSSQVVRAVRFAADLHSQQRRKGTSIPYLSHLLGVAGIVMGAGGGEAEIIAALLHDAVEDQGGAPVMKQIRRRFGPKVATLVEAATEQPHPSWHKQKLNKIQRIASGELSTGGLRVKLADSLYNSTTMTRGARREGPAFWRVFHGKRDGTLWYYDAMVQAFETATADTPQLQPLTQRLHKQVHKLHQAAGQ